LSRFDPSFQIVRHPQERLFSSRSFVELIQAVLEKGADFRLRAKGMSMYPFIRDGDILTLRREAAIREGDISAFSHPQTGGLVIHRLVQRRCGKLLMKGDHNGLPDGWIARERLLARVVRVERELRDVQPVHHFGRRLIALVSTAAALRFFRFSFFKRMMKFGEFY
jgi:phage repressor protein C with HTH and peptisase S24 domain